MRVRDTGVPAERCESLGRMLEETASRHPRRPALFTEGRVVSYRLLDARTNRFASVLRTRLGIRRGDRVAVLLGNGRHFVYSFLGALKAGATVVPLNTFLTAPELRYIMEDSGAKVLVTSDAFAPAVRGFSDSVRSLEAIATFGREDLGAKGRRCDELLRGAGAGPPGVPVGREDLAVVIYTSGTTGRPKGAMLTHGNLLSNLSASAKCIRIGPRDRVVFFIPMFHSFALTACILMPIAVGAGCVAVARLASFPRLVGEMLKRRATIFIGIPHLYDVLAQRGFPWWVRRILRLRLCISGSAPLSAATLRAFEKRVRIPLLEGYGLSETSPVVSINPLDGVRKPGSVGQPIPGVEVRIVSGDGASLPQGERGEVAVRGPNVMRGYLNRPRETKETIRDGWLLTGDIGTLDEDGYLYIVDRKKDMILFHGMNVYPREIEEVLYSHPRVAEAAVVGAPDTHRGEVPVAFVSLREGGGDPVRELVSWCRRHLAAYKVPRRIVVRDKLPRNAAGKIVKSGLREASAAGAASIDGAAPGA